MVKVYDKFGNPRTGTYGSSELVVSYLEGATLDTVTVASSDLVLIKDVSDSGNLKVVLASDLTGGGGGGGSASSITFTPAGNISSTDVQSALEELDTEKEVAGTASSAISTHVSATGAHDATKISVTPTGSISSSTVQDALAELDTEKEATGTAASAISTHEAASDPHTGYQKESEKGVANGYAGLNSSGKIVDSLLTSNVALKDQDISWSGQHDFNYTVSFNNYAPISFIAAASSTDLTRLADVDTLFTNHVNATGAHDATKISVTPTGSISSTTVQAALAELDSEKEVAGTAASAISTHEAASDPHTGYQKESEKGVANGYAGLGATGKLSDSLLSSNVPLLDADNEWTGVNNFNQKATFTTNSPSCDIAASSSDDLTRLADVNTLISTHVSVTGAHDATKISVTPTGAISSTTVQAALAELDTEKEVAGTAASAVSTHAAAGDPHTGYVLASGTRAFTGTVTGVAPTSDLHLSTKKYVDDADSGVIAASLGTFANLNWTFLTLSYTGTYLPYHRQLVGESGVVTLTDAGAQSTLTVGLDSVGARNKVGLNTPKFFQHYEDFVVATAANFASSTSGTGAAIGIGWSYITAYPVVGVVALDTGTTTTGYAALHHWNDVVDPDMGFEISFEAGIMVSSLSTAAEEYVACLGLGRDWNSASETANAMYFVYRRATDGDFWVCITRSSGSETKTVTAVPPSTTGFQVLKIEVASTGDTAVFKIGGTTVATHTTNMTGFPLGYGFKMYKSAGTTTRALVVDYMDFIVKRSSARY